MIPFPVMVKYGNVIPKSVLITDMSAYNQYCAILSSTGTLYTSSPLYFGSNSDGSWTTQRSDVKYMWCSYYCILVQTFTNDFYYIGTNIFSTTRNTTRGSTWINCTTTMNTIDVANINKIQIDTNNVFVLLNDGTIQCIGYNVNGCFGNGTVVSSSTFVQSNITGITDIRLTSTGTEALFLAYNGTRLYGCGQSYNGILGAGGSAATIVSSWYTIIASCTDFKSLSMRSIAYKVGTTWYERGTTVYPYSWGQNYTSQSGGYSNPHAITPLISLSGYFNSHELSSTFSVGTDGYLYASGTNAYGQLGINNLTNTTTPTRVIGFDTPDDIKIIQAYSFNSYILTTGGLLYYCGRNITSLPTGVTGSITTFKLVQLPLQ